MQQLPEENKKPDDEVSWWFKLLTRGLGTVGGIGEFCTRDSVICFRDC